MKICCCYLINYSTMRHEVINQLIYYYFELCVSCCFCHSKRNCHTDSNIWNSTINFQMSNVFQPVALEMRLKTSLPPQEQYSCFTLILITIYILKFISFSRNLLNRKYNELDITYRISCTIEQ